MPARALTINRQIPGPTLRFKEGDTVTIIVHNQLDKETAIHWHGMILPWQMDGVLAITQRGIPPGGEFKYQFKLRQSGTYWYHAHAGLQEQDGMYGALIIDPKTPPPYHYNRDFEMVLSDWSNTEGSHILRNLKKSGEYYSPRFPMQASLEKFIHDYQNADKSQRKRIWMNYEMMQKMRMGIYDYSDVAYDAYLLNGHTKNHPWSKEVRVGDVVRLRFIGAGATTFYRVKIPGSTMQVVHIQGNNVSPYKVKQFSIGPGETVDVLLKIKKNKPYVIYAESSDTYGKVIALLKTAPEQKVNPGEIRPFPAPIPTTQVKMTNEHKRRLDHVEGEMQSELNHQPLINTITAAHLPGEKDNPLAHEHHQTVGSKYGNVQALVKTNHPDKPVYKTIELKLAGFMERYIWFINGTPEYNAKPIELLPGKRYRIVLINNSMMHHPMHLHGHWFILRNGHGAYDPLLHTLDIPPGGEIVADLDTDASGQWFFHCHMLYHMAAGMARVFQYSSIIEVAEGLKKPEHIIGSTGFYNRPIVRVDELHSIPLSMVKDPQPHPKKIYFASNVELGTALNTNAQTLTYTGLYGYDFDKLQLFVNDAEVMQGNIEFADIDIFYWRLIAQFWAIKGGMNYVYRPGEKPYWQPGLGIEGLLPWFIETDARFYMYQGSFKADIEFARNTQLTNNLFLNAAFRMIAATKTIPDAQLGSGLNELQYTLSPNYRLAPGIRVFAEYEYDKFYGKRKTLRGLEGQPGSDSLFYLGLNFIF